MCIITEKMSHGFVSCGWSSQQRFWVGAVIVQLHRNDAEYVALRPWGRHLSRSFITSHEHFTYPRSRVVLRACLEPTWPVLHAHHTVQCLWGQLEISKTITWFHAPHNTSCNSLLNFRTAASYGSVVSAPGEVR